MGPLKYIKYQNTLLLLQAIVKYYSILKLCYPVLYCIPYYYYTMFEDSNCIHMYIYTCIKQETEMYTIYK